MEVWKDFKVTKHRYLNLELSSRITFHLKPEASTINKTEKQNHIQRNMKQKPPSSLADFYWMKYLELTDVNFKNFKKIQSLYIL